MSEKINYIYILSQRYSGSTLLSFLLGAHPEVSTIGERRKFYIKSLKPDGKGNQLCSCGQRFLDCAYWSGIRERMLAKTPAAMLNRNVTEFQLFTNRYLNQAATELCLFCFIQKIPLEKWPFSRRVKELCHFNHELVREILQMDQNKVFLDSSKVLHNALFLSLIDTFNFKIIWLVRDPRAQVSSALKYNKWTVKEATQNWIREMNRNEKVLSKWRPEYIQLRYEALCRNPEKELQRIHGFIGVNAPHQSLDFRSQQQHIMGNTPMRLGKDTRIIERQDWKQRLSSSQIALIEEMASKYQHYFAFNEGN